MTVMKRGMMRTRILPRTTRRSWQPARKSTGANDEANEAVGNEEKENDRRRVLHAKVNTLEHFKKTDRMGFDKVIGTGLDNLLARTVGDAVKVASRQDPGHDGCKDNNAKQQDKNMGQGPPGIF